MSMNTNQEVEMSVAEVEQTESSSRSLTAAERETGMVRTADENVWHVWSCIQSDITKLLANPNFKMQEDTMHGATRMISGTLDLGGITIRAKSAGSIKHNADGKKRERKGTTCGEATGTKTASGSLCGGLAKIVDGKPSFCFKHGK